MALITLASRSHVLGQLFDVLFPYSRKADLQVCQFFIRQENILVTTIGGEGCPVSGRTFSISLFISISFSNSISISGGRMSDKCPPFVRGAERALFWSLAARFRSASVEDWPIKSSMLLM